MKIKSQTVKCKYCGEPRIPVKYKSIRNGYGYYGICPKCGKETMVEEVNTGRK